VDFKDDDLVCTGDSNLIMNPSFSTDWRACHLHSASKSPVQLRTTLRWTIQSPPSPCLSAQSIRICGTRLWTSGVPNCDARPSLAVATAVATAAIGHETPIPMKADGIHSLQYPDAQLSRHRMGIQKVGSANHERCGHPQMRLSEAITA
jgi:hypothetical protein